MIIQSYRFEFEQARGIVIEYICVCIYDMYIKHCILSNFGVFLDFFLGIYRSVSK